MSPINRLDNLHINRGVELILRQRRENKSSKTNFFSFSRTISLLKREITIQLNLNFVKKE